MEATKGSSLDGHRCSLAELRFGRVVAMVLGGALAAILLWRVFFGGTISRERLAEQYELRVPEWCEILDSGWTAWSNRTVISRCPAERVEELIDSLGAFRRVAQPGGFSQVKKELGLDYSPGFPITEVYYDTPPGRALELYVSAYRWGPRDALVVFTLIFDDDDLDDLTIAFRRWFPNLSG